jgi:hypothetical protein
MIDLDILIILFCITVLSTAFTIFVIRPLLKKHFPEIIRADYNEK